MATVVGLSAAVVGGFSPAPADAAPSVQVVDYAATSGLAGSSSTVYSFGRPCVVDLNADGRLDVVWSQHNKAPKNVYLGDAGGGFVLDTRTAWALHDQHSCAVADFDSDGRVDIFESSGACSGTCLKWDEFFLQVAGGSSTTLGDSSGITDAVVRDGLAQTRTEEPGVINRLSNSQTDLRLYRIATGQAVVGLRIAP